MRYTYSHNTETRNGHLEMLSIETIRNETDQVKKSIADRGLTGNIDRIIELDIRRRADHRRDRLPARSSQRS